MTGDIQKQPDDLPDESSVESLQLRKTITKSRLEFESQNTEDYKKRIDEEILEWGTTASKKVIETFTGIEGTKLD